MMNINPMYINSKGEVSIPNTIETIGIKLPNQLKNYLVPNIVNLSHLFKNWFNIKKMEIYSQEWGAYDDTKFDVFSKSVSPTDIKSFNKDIEIEVHLRHYNQIIETLPSNIKVLLEVTIDQFTKLPDRVFFNKNIKINVYGAPYPNVRDEYKTILSKFMALPEYNNIRPQTPHWIDEALLGNQEVGTPLFQTREKIIKETTTVVPYCKENKYIVYDLNSQMFIPCIDIDDFKNSKLQFRSKDGFFNAEEVIDSFLSAINFQNKCKVNKQCQYYCNTTIYKFEPVLHRKILLWTNTNLPEKDK